MRKARNTAQDMFNAFNLAPPHCVVGIVVRDGDGKAMATRIEIQ